MEVNKILYSFLIKKLLFSIENYYQKSFLRGVKLLTETFIYLTTNDK